MLASVVADSYKESHIYPKSQVLSVVIMYLVISCLHFFLVL